jgi:Pilus assembly protein, PilO
MNDKLTPKVVATVAMLAVATIALVGWFGLISPQHSKASDLDRQISEAQTQLAVANSTTHPGARGKASDASTLARAMPDRAEMAAVLRQLLRAANRTDVRLDSVTPQAAATQSGYSAVPMDVIVTGRYSGVQRFLRHLRTQAAVAGPHVHAAGRLFSVDSVNLAAGDKQLPQLAATIHLNAFTYSGSAAAATPATPNTAPNSTTSSSATTSSATSSSAAAAEGTHG